MPEYCCIICCIWVTILSPSNLVPIILRDRCRKYNLEWDFSIQMNRVPFQGSLFSSRMVSPQCFYGWGWKFHTARSIWSSASQSSPTSILEMMMVVVQGLKINKDDKRQSISFVEPRNHMTCHTGWFFTLTSTRPTCIAPKNNTSRRI